MVHQNSLFGNNPKRVDKTSAPSSVPKQNGLFGNAPTRSTPKAPERPSVWIPKKDDVVILININDGIEAIVEAVDMDRLYKDVGCTPFPIQCRIPKLKDMIVYARLDSVKLKK